jgi:hypothetical protein
VRVLGVAGEWHEPLGGERRFAVDVELRGPCPEVRAARSGHARGGEALVQLCATGRHRREVCIERGRAAVVSASAVSASAASSRSAPGERS